MTFNPSPGHRVTDRPFCVALCCVREPIILTTTVVHNCTTVAVMTCSPHLPTHEALVCDHNDPALAVVGSRQESPSVRGGANWEGKRAVNKDLGRDRAAGDVKLGHALQKELQIILKVLANSGLWKYMKDNKEHHDGCSSNTFNSMFVILCLTRLAA